MITTAVQLLVLLAHTLLIALELEKSREKRADFRPVWEAGAEIHSLIIIRSS